MWNMLNAFGFETEAGNAAQPERADESMHMPFGDVQDIRRFLANPAKRRF